MNRVSELSSVANLISGRLPLVPILCTATGAAWKDKWHFNTSTEWVKSIGGPWNSREDAVNAALKTGFYRLREGTKTPHLDAI